MAPSGTNGCPDMGPMSRDLYGIVQTTFCVITPQLFASEAGGSSTPQSGRHLFLRLWLLLLLCGLLRQCFGMWDKAPFHIGRLVERLGCQLRQFVGILSVSIVACF